MTDSAKPRGSLVGGRWIESGKPVVNQDPARPDEPVGVYLHADEALVDEAVKAAHAARAAWAAVGPLERAELLDRIGTELIARRDELGRVLCRENGKTLREATMEVLRSGQAFKLHASDAMRADGETYMSGKPGQRVEARREPVGVVAALTPWNFPMSMAARKLAPALALGNTVVFKPSDLVPASAWALAEVASRVLPAGVFNLVLGDGAVGRALVSHPKVAAVTFTGSTNVGLQIGQACAARNARYQLEMGGKNAVAVLDEAMVDAAVEAIVQGAYHSGGQRCTASSRIIVLQPLHARLIDGLVKRIARIRVGDPLDAETEVGPLANEGRVTAFEASVARARDEGAKLLAGGERITRPGCFVTPTLLDEVRPGMSAWREELFAPIAGITVARDVDHAIELVNDSDYGLSVAVFASNAQVLANVTARVETGVVVQNGSSAGLDLHAPFTGRKASSFGPPEGSTFVRDFFTAVKVVYRM